MPGPLDNPYQAPEQPSPPKDSRSRPVKLSLITIVFLSLLLIFVLVSQNILTAIYEDFDLDLPGLSELAMHLQTVLAIGATLSAALIAAVAIRHRQTAIVCYVILLVIGVALLMTYLLGAALPLINLVVGLS